MLPHLRRTARPILSSISNRQYNTENYSSFLGSQLAAGQKYHNNKKTTGITGLRVEPEAGRILPIFYDRLIEILETKFPEDYAYSKTMKEFYTEKKNLLENCESIADFEEKMNMSIEMAMFHAKEEINLAMEMAEDRPWEELVEEAPEGQWQWP